MVLTLDGPEPAPDVVSNTELGWAANLFPKSCGGRNRGLSLRIISPRLSTHELQNNGSPQRGVENWRDKSRHARREAGSTKVPMRDLISKRLPSETDDF